jgi:hypothetical protein
MYVISSLLMRAFHTEIESNERLLELLRVERRERRPFNKSDSLPRSKSYRPGQPHLRRMLELLDPLTQILTDYSERR